MTLRGNSLIMREVNKNLVRKTLKSKKLATKQQLAEETGLSIVTVATILQQLVGSNQVFEVDLAPSRGGRPAHQFRFNENHSHILVLFTLEQSGQDMLHICIANLYGDCVKSQNIPLDEIRLESFEPWIDACLEQYPSIRAIGFGLPGFEVDGKIIVLDYPALVGEQLTRHYADRYQIPVILENDVNAAVVGYCKRNSIQTKAAVIYTYFPKKYPPGAGIYIDGQLYKGMSNFAGEISAIPFGFDWRDPDLFYSEDQFSEAIAKVVIAMSSLLNPQVVVLYGEFLTSTALKNIKKICSASLPSTSLPGIHLSEEIFTDYQNGMIALTLESLESQVYIKQSS